ncbi:hypothetical protein PIB30_011784 [Stylosanthes scabra]|uniref:peroxidase n=1 Tax=Stylosanthes scabra TaxID=79078 RepID=A0ABU6R6Z7_9FABA|nr:hypothetical protein [Stylosanthes scabra]
MVALCCLVLTSRFRVNAQLSPDYYSTTCPNLRAIVRRVIVNAAQSNPRIFASLLRLHFHDCFVLGCDASILLDATPNMESEQDALANKNSIRGLNVISQIKTEVEKACPKTVSCADILALSAQISTTQSGGPFWNVTLGRLDGLVANQSRANQNLPGFFFTLPQLKATFSRHGLNATDLVALSGAHTFGRGHCSQIRGRLYNFRNTGKPDPSLNTTYLTTLRTICPNDKSNPGNIINLDVSTLIDSTTNTSRILKFTKDCFEVIKSCSQQPVQTPLLAL